MDELYVFLKLMGWAGYVLLSIYASLTSLRICGFRSYYWATSQDEEHAKALRSQKSMSTDPNETFEQLGCCIAVFFYMIIWPVILFFYITGKYVPIYTRKICTFLYNLRITLPKYEIKVSFNKKKSGCVCRTDIPYPND